MTTRNRTFKIALVVFVSMLAVNVLYEQSLDQPNLAKRGENNSPNFSLIPPSVYALTDLNTSNVGLFAYYYYSLHFVLNNSVAAWQNYTDYGNYYEGYVRVWQDVTGGTYEGAWPYGCYIDVHCQLKANGWVLTWLDQTQNKGQIPYWGKSLIGSSNPIANATSLMRAMERVFYVANLTWVGYTNVKMYDYQYPTATKLVIFGVVEYREGGAYNRYWYASIPSSTNTEIIKSYVAYGCWNDYYLIGEYDFYVNGVKKVTVNGGTNWTATDITSALSLDSTITFRVWYFAGSGYGVISTTAIMIWLR